MRLTRRDAVAALVAGGIAVGTAGIDVVAPTAAGDGRGPGTGGRGDGEPARHDAGEFGGHERETFAAIASVVYPTAVEGVGAFVGASLDGRVAADPGFADGAADAVRTLDGAAREWHGAPAVELHVDTRGRLLRELGAGTADPDPDGSPAARVRYFVVNELLFALYASPTGGELVGIENPQGHPGGTASYRRGPDG